MRRLIRITVVLLVLGGLGAGVYALRQNGRRPPNYRHAEVTRGAVANAASIAAMILTTEALITDAPEKEKPPAAPPMPEY